MKYAYIWNYGKINLKTSLAKQKREFELFIRKNHIYLGFENNLVGFCVVGKKYIFHDQLNKISFHSLIIYQQVCLSTRW